MGEYALSDDLTKRLQEISLNILHYFDSFCKENGLTYFLCGGCCIGAIRNGGFIPWDDDVDVFMPRDDYETLKKVWTDTDQYEIEFADRDHRCNSTSIRICDKNTTFIHSYTVDKDVSHSVAMDVFPIDGCPTGFKRKMQKIWAMLFSLMIVEKSPKNHGKLIDFIGRLGLTIIPTWGLRCKVWRYAEKKMSKYSIKDCDRITELCAGPGYMQNEYPRKAFDKAVLHKFEDGEYPIPCGYDDYLKMAFGDYMKLPPEDQRVAHHEYEFIDLERPYRDYKGIKYMKEKA